MHGQKIFEVIRKYLREFFVSRTYQKGKVVIHDILLLRRSI